MKRKDIAETAKKIYELASSLDVEINGQKAKSYVVLLDEARRIIKRHNLGKKTNALEYVHPRQYLMSYLRHNTSLGPTKIAGLFGDYHHSTVIHAVKEHKNRVELNDEVYLRNSEAVANEIIHLKFSVIADPDRNNILMDVLNCENFWEMKQLQEKIKEKYKINETENI